MGKSSMFFSISDTYPPLVFPSMHMLVEAINLHVITSSWDLQFLSCLSESTRLKSAIINVAANMKEGGMRQIMCNGIKATRTGTLFYDTIKVNIYVARHFFENHLIPFYLSHLMLLIIILFQSISRLNNKCHPDMIRDFIEHGGHDPEEFPFMEEVQALRR